MATLLVLIIILGCIAYQYFLSTFVKSFAMVINVICASIIAFAYFESLARLLISREMFPLWAQSISFGILFVISFAILQTAAEQLLRKKIDLGFLPERIGRVICGILAGLIISGTVLTTLTMAPFSNKNPYQRFDAKNPNIEKPGNSLLNTDGFITGWFGLVSKGSFSGKRSFDVLHSDFLDQIFLNRHESGISLTTDSEAIEVPKTQAAWLAPENLKDPTGKSIPSKSGYKLTFVRIGLKKSAVKEEKFTLSQLRVICKHKDDLKNLLAGKGKPVYPAGYLRTPSQLQTKRLNDTIELTSEDFDGSSRQIDFAFYIPNDFVPVLVEFKQNNIAKLHAPGTYEQTPTPIPFIQASQCTQANAEVLPVSTAKIYGVELTAGPKSLADIQLNINDPNQWQSAQTENSIIPAQFDDGTTNHVRAELKIEKPTTEEAAPAPVQRRRRRGPKFSPIRSAARKQSGLPGLLKPLKGYELLSLKCNTPPVGAAIKGQQLPVLVELSGRTHHPVGVVISGKIDDQDICEFDYCSLPAEDDSGCLVIAEDGSVKQPFPDSVWLPEKAQSISQFHVLYLVKKDGNVIITSVKPAGVEEGATFKEYVGFLVK